MALNNNNREANMPKMMAVSSKGKRHLRRVIAGLSGAGLGAFSTCLWGLGLGDVQSQSYLGQPLNAQIELVSVEGEVDPDNLLVRLISQEEANELGVDYFYTPYKFKFDVTQTGKGYFVQVNSDQPVNEPFLSLLVELRWPSGTVLREYDILLDPPPTVNLASRNEEPETAPQTMSDRLAGEATNKPAPAQAAPAYRMELKPLDTQDGQYQVQSGDTLFGIAERWSEGTDVSLYETSEWLFENNPQAFVRNNRNMIKAGARLSLPDLQEYKVSDEKLESLQSDDDSIVITEKEAEPAKSVAELPDVDNVRDEKTEANSPQDAAATSDVKGLLTVSNVNRDDRTRELIDLLVRENESLKSRIEKLESSEYVATMRELVILQRQEIAELRSELGVNSNEEREEQVDDMLTEIGLDEKVVLSETTVAADQPNTEKAVPVTPEQAQLPEPEDAVVSVDSSNIVSGAVQEQAQKNSWLFWVLFAAGAALAAIFAIIFFVYRKMVSSDFEEEESAEEEQSDLTPLKTVKFHAISDQVEAKKAKAKEDQEDTIAFGDVQIENPDLTENESMPDWLGERAVFDDTDEELAGAIKEIQEEFSNLTLDDESLEEVFGEGDDTLEALTEELPTERVRRPDDEVKLSIAEKMAKYNPEEFKEELDSLAVLEVDEDELDIDEDNDVDAIIYRAMMYCEFKKFDKARELVQSKVELFDDTLLENTLAKIESLENNHQKRANG